MSRIFWPQEVPEQPFDGAPVPLGQLDRRRFPDVLPPPLGAFVDALAAATQTPRDLAGSLALGAVAGALGRSVDIDVAPGWWEPPNLYLVSALSSGERKSTVFRQTLRPLEDAERVRIELAEPVIRERTIDRELADAVARKAVNKAAGGDPQLLEAAKAARLNADAIEIPDRPRILADDATPEAFARLLADNDGWIVVASAEGGVFEGLSRYQRTGIPNLDAFLKAHAGDTIRVDRISRPSIFISRPAATVILAVQPEVIANLSRHEGFRGRGLLARFLYSLPPSIVGRREIHPPAVPRHVEEAYAARIRELAELQPREPTSDGATTRPHAIVLGDPARGLLDQYRARLEPRLGGGGDLEHIADWANKLPGAAVRIAAAVHMAELGRAGLGQPIAAGSMVAGLELADYFLDHALAAFALMGEAPGHRAARKIHAWIIRTGCPEFSERDVFQAVKGPVPTMAALREGLEVLMDHRWVAGPYEHRRPTGTPGRPRAPVYLVNPEAASPRPPPSSEDSEDTRHRNEVGESSSSGLGALDRGWTVVGEPAGVGQATVVRRDRPQNPQIRPNHERQSPGATMKCALCRAELLPSDGRPPPCPKTASGHHVNEVAWQVLSDKERARRMTQPFLVTPSPQEP